MTDDVDKSLVDVLAQLKEIDPEAYDKVLIRRQRLFQRALEDLPMLQNSVGVGHIWTSYSSYEDDIDTNRILIQKTTSLTVRNPPFELSGIRL